MSGKFASDSLIGSIIVFALTIASRVFPALKKKNDRKKEEAELIKIKTDTFITTERFKKEEFEDALKELEILRDVNKKLKEQLEASMKKIEMLSRKINVLETFYTQKK